MQFCPETRTRIKVAVAAYAYEVMDDPIMSDAEFDRLARAIRPSVMTGNFACDMFFATAFDPSTGSWVRSHPGYGKLHGLYLMTKRATEAARSRPAIPSPVLPSGHSAISSSSVPVLPSIPRTILPPLPT